MKLIRQPITENGRPIVDLSDLDNLENYFTNKLQKRRFVIEIVSKSHQISPDVMEEKLRTKIQNFKNKSSLNNLLDFYFFNKYNIVKYFMQDESLKVCHLR